MNEEAPGRVKMPMWFYYKAARNGNAIYFFDGPLTTLADAEESLKELANFVGSPLNYQIWQAKESPEVDELVGEGIAEPS